MNKNIDYNLLLQKMINGQLNQEERYWLEKKALDDPMLFDAIEGFSTNPDTGHLNIVSALQSKVLAQKEEKVTVIRRLRVPISIAASLAILLFAGNYFINRNTPDNSLAGVPEDNITESVEGTNTLTDADIPDEPASPTAKTSPVSDNINDEIAGTTEEVNKQINPIVKPEQDGMTTTALKPPTAPSLNREMAMNESEAKPAITVDENTLDPKEDKSEMALAVEQPEIEPKISLSKKSRVTGDNKMGLVNRQEIPSSPALRDLYLQREITSRYTQLDNYIPVKEDITFILLLNPDRTLNQVNFESGNKDAAAIMIPIIEQLAEVIISTSDDKEKVKFTYKSK